MSSRSKLFWTTLGRLVRFSRREYAAALLPQVLRLGLAFVPGLIVRDIFNRLSNNAALDWNWWALVAAVVGIALARVVSLIGAVGLESTALLRSGALLRTNLFEQLLIRPDATLLPFTSGEVVNRIRMDGRMLPLVLARIEILFGSAVTGLVALIAMLSINWLYALVALVPVAACVFAVNFINQRRDPVIRAERMTDGQVSAFLGEAFASVQAIQMAGAEVRAAQHLRKLNQKRQHAAIQSRVIEAWIGLFIQGFEQIGAALVLLLAAGSLQSGRFTIGDYALFTYAAPAVVDTAFYVGALISDIKNAHVAFDRMNEMTLLGDANTSADTFARRQPIQFGLGRRFIEPKSLVAEPVEPLQLLETRRLTRHYPGTTRGISQIDLRVQAGTLTVITGKMGAGKTTLLRTLLGLMPLDAGEIVWNGTPVSNPAEFFAASRTAYTPQIPRLFSESLLENIVMGQPSANLAPVYVAVHAAVLDADVAQLERGLDTTVGPRGVKLSGGQLQRVAVARALYRQPDLLVFDDLSSALDVETERQLWEGLCAKVEGGSARPRTILAVSNRRATLQFADHIIVLEDGHIAAQGSLAELLQSCEPMREIWAAH